MSSRQYMHSAVFARDLHSKPFVFAFRVMTLVAELIISHKTIAEMFSKW